MLCCFSRVFLLPVLLIFECVIAPFIGIEDLSGRIPLYYFVEQLFEGSSIVLTGKCITCSCVNYYTYIATEQLIQYMQSYHTI